MEDGNRREIVQEVEGLVHGVVADEDAVRAEAGESIQLPPEQPGDLVPAVVKQALERVEVDAQKDQFGRVVATEPLLHEAVEDAVVLDGGGPARAAQQSDGAHAILLWNLLATMPGNRPARRHSLPVEAATEKPSRQGKGNVGRSLRAVESGFRMIRHQSTREAGGSKGGAAP